MRLILLTPYQKSRATICSNITVWVFVEAGVKSAMETYKKKKTSKASAFFQHFKIQNKVALR